MKYVTGESVELGDLVSLGADNGGVVVCVIDRGAYSSGYPEEEWGHLESGVLISFPIYGLIHYNESLELDIKLIVRGAV